MKPRSDGVAPSSSAGSTTDAGQDAAAPRPRQRMKVKSDVRAGDGGFVNGHKPP